MTIKRKTLIYIVSILFVHTILYAFSYYFGHKKNQLFIDLRQYEKMIKIKTLLLGDSHVARSIDESMMDSTYSLAFFGENNVMNYYKLKYCLDHHFTKPQYIVLPCDAITFSKRINEHRTNKFFYYSIIPIEDAGILDENKLFAYYDYVKTKLVPYAEWRYILNRLNAHRQQKVKQNFIDVWETKNRFGIKHFIENVILSDGNKDNLYYPKALSYLDKIIRLCEKNKIKLVFVKFPHTKMFLDELKLQIGNEYYNNRPAEKMISNYNIPILNFEKLFLDEPKLFFDFHHLNEIGRAKFTNIFKQKLDSLYKVY